MAWLLQHLTVKIKLIALLFDCIATGGYCNEFQHRVYSSVDVQWCIAPLNQYIYIFFNNLLWWMFSTLKNDLFTAIFFRWEWRMSSCGGGGGGGGGGGRLNNRVHDDSSNSGSSYVASPMSLSASSDSAHRRNVSDEESVTVSGRSRQQRHRLQLLTASIDQVIGLTVFPTDERIDQSEEHVSSPPLIYYYS